PPGRVVGSCGPTTSRRMDRYTLPLLKQGIKAMIGKGERSAETKRDIENCGAVYLVTLGGAGALLAGRVKKAETICYPELMAEAVMRLEVENFPVICAYDTCGGDIFSMQTERYRRL
ncbi:MAG: fumarate hydratase C-terminal domain-containing protein, partial [Dehalococcoidaceae bacterium]|nr:fumarate hydratase C-terminal domain-containing protein [Dehalococcoidaceae bacterium]